MMQCAAERLFSQFLRDLDPGIIRLTPRGHLVILFRRHREMASLDFNVPVQTREHLRILQAVAPVCL